MAEVRITKGLPADEADPECAIVGAFFLIFCVITE